MEAVVLQPETAFEVRLDGEWYEVQSGTIHFQWRERPVPVVVLEALGLRPNTITIECWGRHGGYECYADRTYAPEELTAWLKQQRYGSARKLLAFLRTKVPTTPPREVSVWDLLVGEDD